MSLTESTMLELGTTAPDFALTDVVSGETVRRDDFRGSQALLVLFICAHCPYVKHIEKGLAALGRDYAGKPLGLVAISSNDAVTHPADNPAGLKQQAETFGFNFPYLYDETQAVLVYVLKGHGFSRAAKCPIKSGALAPEGRFACTEWDL